MIQISLSATINVTNGGGGLEYETFNRISFVVVPQGNMQHS